MEKNTLDKLMQKLEADEDLGKIGQLDKDTKELLQKMVDGEVEVDRAIETFLDEKTKL